MSSKTNSTATTEEAKPALVPQLRFPEFRNLPSWSETTVGRISDTVIAGGTPSTTEKKFWGGEIRWMNSGELNDKKVSEVQGRITRDGLNNSSTKPIPPRCVLIGLAGQGKTRGTVAMNLVELCTNQSIAAIFPNDSAFNSDFLYHDLDKRYDELRRLSAGGEGRGGLNLQIIKALKVALPSLPEQQKIAECLSSVDELMDAQARKVDALKTHKKGLIQQLFPREGETQPRLRFPEFQNAGEWVQKTVGDVSEVLMCKRIFAEETNPNEGVPFYKIGTLGGVPDAFISRERFEDYKLRYNYPRKGEVLITCSGTVGKCLPFDGKEAYFQDSNIVWLDNPTGEVSNEFLLMLLSNVNWGSLNSTTITRIYGPDLRGMAIKYPEDEAEQERIASCLSSLDALITAETQKHEALKTHKKGLMQQLFPSPDTQQIST